MMFLTTVPLNTVSFACESLLQQRRDAQSSLSNPGLTWINLSLNTTDIDEAVEHAHSNPFMIG